MEPSGYSTAFIIGFGLGVVLSAAVLGLLSEKTWVWHDGFYAAYTMQREGKLEELAPSSIKERFEIAQVKKKFEGKK
jgi:hypothetical protein